MIKTGKKINTNFSLDILQDGKVKTVSFSELLDRPSVVSIYMRNYTSGCDKQNASLAEHADWFEKKGYNLIAISKDTSRSHKKYAEKMGIKYMLGSDPEYKFARATGSIVEKSMFGKTYLAPSRSAYIIETDGTIIAIIAKVNTNDHAQELKELIGNL